MHQIESGDVEPSRVSERSPVLAIGRAARTVRGLAREHWQLTLILLIGLALRVATEVAYYPIVFYPDSWNYVSMAFHPPFVSFTPIRPSGYPFFVLLLTLDNHSLFLLSAVQHVAGLVTAVMVYAIGLRLRLGRWVSAAIAGLVALGSEWIALAQYMMTESFFALCLVGAALALIYHPRSRWHWVLSGALIAVAATMRPGALFAVPAWFAFALVSRVGWRTVLPGIVALAVPLLGYCTLHAADGRGFSLVQSSNWFLYGAVAPTARCTKTWPTTAELRALCPTQEEIDAPWGPNRFLWLPSSPMRLEFGSMYSKDLARKSAVIGEFAHQALERRPLAYLKGVGRYLLKAFEPDGGGSSNALEFLGPGIKNAVTGNIMAAYEPHYHQRIAAPYSELRKYSRVFHTPRPLIGLLAIFGLLSLALAAVSRGWRRISMPAETLLLTGMGLGVFVGSTATASLELRYLIPVVPLVALGGAVSLFASSTGLRLAVGRFRQRGISAGL
jgi:hypothetical protein